MHYDTTNTGTLWLETELKHGRSPNFTGKSELQCPSCNHKFVKPTVGWNKTTKTGKDLISIVFNEPKEDGQTQGGSWEAAGQKLKKEEVVTDISDDPIDLSEIPF